MGRSLRASEEGLAKAKKAFEIMGWTQDHLAGAARCSRGTVINFFARRPVAKRLFYSLCIEIGLEWGEVAEIETEEAPEYTPDIDELVVSVRDDIYDSIVEKCGFMRVLDMSQPIGLDDIYTDVNILEKITGRRRLSISQLLEQADIENFGRFSLGSICEGRVPGLKVVEQHSKLMIFGKPGAGKTTFLKHLAIQCVKGRFKPKLVPLFVTLKDFAEDSGQPSLLKYLTQMFASYGINPDTKAKAKTVTSSKSRTSAMKSFLNQGRVLILLDGLDEIRESDSSRVFETDSIFCQSVS